MFEERIEQVVDRKLKERTLRKERESPLPICTFLMASLAALLTSSHSANCGNIFRPVLTMSRESTIQDMSIRARLRAQTLSLRRCDRKRSS